MFPVAGGSSHAPPARLFAVVSATTRVPACLRLQLCAGHIRVKNNRNILLKNLLDCAVGTVSWFLLG